MQHLFIATRLKATLYCFLVCAVTVYSNASVRIVRSLNTCLHFCLLVLSISLGSALAQALSNGLILNGRWWVCTSGAEL
jgi:DMSO reductase anchor subunit